MWEDPGAPWATGGLALGRLALRGLWETVFWQRRPRTQTSGESQAQEMWRFLRSQNGPPWSPSHQPGLNGWVGSGPGKDWPPWESWWSPLTRGPCSQSQRRLWHPGIPASRSALDTPGAAPTQCCDPFLDLLVSPHTPWLAATRQSGGPRGQNHSPKGAHIPVPRP